ncbi:MAG TPA: hypothetical protein VLM39_03655 [Ignavibacteriaceae bacterium]|nr:hypothetical protein [Ignavibacteriaceae bacterium]
MKGENYKYEISKDLIFELLPIEYGWLISIRNKSQSENYCGIATPPFHGINSLYIEGWHFRNADNSGLNGAGEKNINAPQETREFSFLLDHEGYKKTVDLLDTMMHHGNISPEKIMEAEAGFEKIKKGNGKLEIIEMKLENLKLNEKSAFSYMKFSAELNIPAYK